jgi:hypothetical protein
MRRTIALTVNDVDLMGMETATFLILGSENVLYAPSQPGGLAESDSGELPHGARG